jgi:hypothetical protein
MWQQRRRVLQGGLMMAAPFAPRAAARAAGAPHAALLADLLARNRRKHPGHHTSNHTSMALMSLSALGASPARLREVGEQKLRRGTSPFPTSGPAVTREGWRRALGDPGALHGLHALFTAEIARLGVGEALRLYLPELMRGVGAHAFHPVIRTAYGVRFGDAAEVAMGLAYWAVTFLPLGPLAPAGAHVDPAAALAAVRAIPQLTPEGRRAAGIERPGGLNIAGKMQWASGLAGFKDAASGLRPGVPLPAIASSMVGLYLGSDDDFTALHAITGTHAFRLLEPHLADADLATARRHLWQALVAAYVSIDAPAPTVPATAKTVPSWTEIVTRATASDDDHDLKLTDVAREEERHHRDPRYRRAAAAHLGLV